MDLSPPPLRAPKASRGVADRICYRHYDKLYIIIFSDDEGPGNPMVSKFDEDVHFDEYDTGFNQQHNINGSDNQDYESL